MKTIAISSQKGEAGKTTLAVNLPVAANKATRGKAVIIDRDPQASVASWHDSREEETPVVVSAQASRLIQVLEAARESGAKLVIIDTAPRSESASLVAARAADLVLIPCRPAILDLRAINNAIDLVRLVGARAAIVLNCVPPRGSIADEAVEAVTDYSMSLVLVRITHRAAFIHSLTVGESIQEYEPAGKGAKEIKQLYKWTCKEIKRPRRCQLLPKSRKPNLHQFRGVLPSSRQRPRRAAKSRRLSPGFSIQPSRASSSRWL